MGTVGFCSVLAIPLFVVACSGSPANSAAQIQPGAAAMDRSSPIGTAGTAPAQCRDLPSVSDLKKWLRQAPSEGGEAGGLFSGRREWAAIVNRQGMICATAVATDDPAASWPGSQAISKAKAYSANSYSTDDLPLSTARLYTLSQPGHSLWGVSQPNPFDAGCLVEPGESSKTDGKICGGAIAFGGGVPLYEGETRVGGLGVSGDTACADHEIAKRIRHFAQLDPEKGEFADDIVYGYIDGPSVFSHPLCANTWRNGKKLGDEKPVPE